MRCRSGDRLHGVVRVREDAEHWKIKSRARFVINVAAARGLAPLNGLQLTDRSRANGLSQTPLLDSEERRRKEMTEARR